MRERIIKDVRKEDEVLIESAPTCCLIMSQHSGSRDERTNLLSHRVNSAVFNLSSEKHTVCKPAMIQEPARFMFKFILTG